MLSNLVCRLFAHIPDGVLQRKTIQTLMALFDNYEDSVDKPEVVTPEEEDENNAFLDALVETAVMQQAHQFLVSKRIDTRYYNNYDLILILNLLRLHRAGPPGNQHIQRIPANDLVRHVFAGSRGRRIVGHRTRVHRRAQTRHFGSPFLASIRR